MLSNYFGTLWIALTSLIFVPFYLYYIGVEGYGLVGFFTMLTVSLGILDGGLGAVALRESSRYLIVEKEEKEKILNRLKAMEVIFWALAFVFGMLVALSANLIVDLWLNVKPDKYQNTLSSIRWMALALLTQFPISFYSNSISGLQRQVALNLINSVMATLRGVGAIVVLSSISPTTEAFFAWNALIGVISIFIYRYYLFSRTKIDYGFKKIRFSDLAEVKQFMIGAGLINILSLLLSQLDKIILSKVLTLENFGYYTLAWMLGTVVYRFTGPIFNAYYPKLTELFESNRESMMIKYEQSCVLIAIAIVPISLWIVFFSKYLLLLWTHNNSIANAASGALSIIALGTLCNSLMHMPYALQLAHGYTRLALWQNIFTLIIMAPLTWILATKYSLTVAALPWLIINLSYVVITPYLMHKQLSINGLKNWYLNSVFQPILISSLVMLLGNHLLDFTVSYVFQALQLAIILLSAIIISLVFSGLPVFRKITWKNIL